MTDPKALEAARRLLAQEWQTKDDRYNAPMSLKDGVTVARALLAGEGPTIRDAALEAIGAIKSAALSPSPAVRDAPVFAFLLGAGPLDGQWFGDKHPTGKGAFWWRKHLRAALHPSVAEPDAPKQEQVG